MCKNININIRISYGSFSRGIVSANINKLTISVIFVALAVIVHNLLGYIGGYIVASKIGFSEEKRRVLSIETGMKNETLATTIAMAHFAPQAAIALAIAGIWHAFSVSVLANYWANKNSEVKKSSTVELAD
ncbi:hypothetical protein [Romboutsia sp. 1001713B170207_170306_H8]|uniref:hypothetical protein n=1 Tax=Romboutsia sp. 1001713B170207_170306_H8 TaxID=2787112 RepID=UPI001896E23D|nr:hypothetical protein [Romboutsia sp. 1001713B170207_170306_H8]